MVQEVVYLFHC